MRNQGFTLVELLIVLTIVAILILTLVGFSTGGFPKENQAKQAIETAGFKDVQNVQRHWWGSHYFYGCDNEEALAFTAQATNSNNQRVHVTACTSYFFKGFTIRMGR